MTDQTGVFKTGSHSWMQTYHGRRVSVDDPRPEEMFIDDIAHALSLVCRFGGHCKEFYSVAQHSVLGARWAIARGDKDLAREFLLHDATEAYVGDLIRPVKVQDATFVAIETAFHQAIGKRFNVPIIMTADCKALDNTMLAWEKRDLLPNSEKWPGLPTIESSIPSMEGWSSANAKWQFQNMYEELFSG